MGFQESGPNRTGPLSNVRKYTWKRAASYPPEGFPAVRSREPKPAGNLFVSFASSYYQTPSIDDFN